MVKQSTSFTYYLLVEYPDGTFRVYEDTLKALRAYRIQKGERTHLLRRWR